MANKQELVHFLEQQVFNPILNASQPGARKAEATHSAFCKGWFLKAGRRRAQSQV